VRIRLLALLAPLTGLACGGTLSYDSDGGAVADAAPDQAARDEFALNVAPVLKAACDVCHETGTGGAPIFSPPDTPPGTKYAVLTTWVGVGARIKDLPLLSCSQPDQSPLITYGPHTGPAFTNDQVAPTAAWITTWKGFQTGCEPVAAVARSAAVTPLTGGTVNTIDLAPLGPGLEGATLTFTADLVAGQDLYLSNLKVNAGAGGLKVVHPTFEYCLNGSEEKLDPTDKFKNVTLDVAPAGTAQIGPGSLSLVGIPAGTPLAVKFVELTPQAGSQGDAVDNGGSCP
jgi:hypothetical protein